MSRRTEEWYDAVVRFFETHHKSYCVFLVCITPLAFCVGCFWGVKEIFGAWYDEWCYSRQSAAYRRSIRG